MAQQVQDEGFHEIQLNGKQLVFLFMAATVVSVVIFLCGVLVGRGVKTQLASIADVPPASTVAETTPMEPATPAAAPAAGSDPTSAPPPPPATEDLSYFKRLEQANAPAEKLKADSGRGASTPDRSNAAAAAPAPAPAPPKEKSVAAAAPAPAPLKEKPVAAPAPAPPKDKPVAAAPTKEAAPAKVPAPTQAVAPSKASAAEPLGEGFAVQIAALNVRSDADAIAKRLSSKGYTAYVLTPASGSPSVFRVRVGKFNTRHEADAVAARLQKEEQFKPWVTR